MQKKEETIDVEENSAFTGNQTHHLSTKNILSFASTTLTYKPLFLVGRIESIFLRNAKNGRGFEI